MNRQLWLGSAVVALALSGCMVREPPVVGVSTAVAPVDYGTAYPASPPPAAMAEYRPPPPGFGYVWVDGYWDWTGYDWAWTSGAWAPERVGYVYVRPTYVYDHGSWVYHRSYWNGPEGRRDYEWGRPARGGPGYVAPPVRGAPGPGPTAYGAPVRGAPAPAAAPNRGWTEYGRGVPPGAQPSRGAPPTEAPQARSWTESGRGAPPGAPAASASRPGYASPPGAGTALPSIRGGAAPPGQSSGQPWLAARPGAGQPAPAPAPAPSRIAYPTEQRTQGQVYRQEVRPFSPAPAGQTYAPPMAPAATSARPVNNRPPATSTSVNAGRQAPAPVQGGSPPRRKPNGH